MTQAEFQELLHTIWDRKLLLNDETEFARWARAQPDATLAYLVLKGQVFDASMKPTLKKN